MSTNPFSPEVLKSIIENRLNSAVDIPQGHKGAVFGFADTNGVQAGVAFKTNNGWQIQGDVSYVPHSDGLSAGLNILKTW